MKVIVLIVLTAALVFVSQFLGCWFEGGSIRGSSCVVESPVYIIIPVPSTTESETLNASYGELQW